jgi:REP element-mobilizing transposase RayT
MKNLDYREFYRRNLPHIQPRGATFLVNFRLANSLPTEVVERLRADAEELEKCLLAIKDLKEKHLLRDKKQRELFNKWDDALHKSQSGPLWLKDEKIAEIVAYSIRYHDGKWFDVVAYRIMPNHVHLVLTPYELSETADYSLTKIMHNIKRNSANHANKVLGRTGSFWQHENYDHFVRDQADLERIVKYVLYNPVEAGLVKEQKDWKWSYCKYDM